MPRVTLSTEQLIVYDDFLPRDAADELLTLINRQQFFIVHMPGWIKVWRLGDGLPLQGATTVYRPRGRYKAHEELRYPTNSLLDVFIEAMQGVATEAEGLIGRSGADWDAMFVRPSVYPTGTGLSVHRDGTVYAGSYVYFVHREWNFHWGGHLLVLDLATDPSPSKIHPPFLSDEDENRIISEPGLATCILAKPNRLVLLGPEAMHMVTRVDANAGNRPRVSLAGFFLRPRKRRSRGA